MSFQNFSCTRVVDVRTTCIRDIWRLVDDGWVTCIFQAPWRIISRSFQCINGILESSLFEGNLPVVYSLYQIRNPFLGSCRIDVNGNWLFRFYKLSTQIGCFVLRLQTPSRNKFLVFDTLWVAVEIGITNGEVAYTRIEQSGFHRYFGKQNHWTVQFVSQWYTRTSGFQKSYIAHTFFTLVSDRSRNLNIFWKCFQSIDVGSFTYHVQ